MIVYLARKYYINAIVFFLGFIILPYFSFGDLAYLFPRAVFLGGLAAVIYTWYDFNKRNLWPLYDNLRYSKYLILAGFFLSLQLLPFILSPLY